MTIFRYVCFGFYILLKAIQITGVRERKLEIHSLSVQVNERKEIGEN